MKFSKYETTGPDDPYPEIIDVPSEAPDSSWSASGRVEDFAADPSAVQISWKDSLATQMSQMMDRSNSIREDLHNRLYVAARERVLDILNEPITPKTMATISQTALKVLSMNVVAPPTMNFQAVAKMSGMSDPHQGNHTNESEYKVVELTEERLQEATQNAIRAQLQVAEWRDEQLRKKEEVRSIEPPSITAPQGTDSEPTDNG